MNWELDPTNCNIVDLQLILEGAFGDRVIVDLGILFDILAVRAPEGYKRFSLPAEVQFDSKHIAVNDAIVDKCVYEVRVVVLCHFLERKSNDTSHVLIIFGACLVSHEDMLLEGVLAKPDSCFSSVGVQMPVEVSDLDMIIKSHALLTRVFLLGIACHVFTFDEEVRGARVNRQLVGKVVYRQIKSEKRKATMQRVSLVGTSEVPKMAKLGLSKRL